MSFAWEDVKIKRDNGAIVTGKAPVIISASRSTDIPAFYAKWLLNRIDKGYCTWYNPFNKSQPIYVSFQNTKVIVFWTKNAKPIIPLLPELDKRGIHYYFQYTLNDYEHEGLEPGIPKLEKRILTFITLSELIGKEKVIWRFDPIILTNTITVRDLLKKIWNVGNKIKGHTDKLVFSFADIKAYRKVQNTLIRESDNFNTDNVEKAELDKSQINELVEGLVKIQKAWQNEGWNIKLATCSEKIDLENYGIEHNRCVDGELIEKLFPNDLELIHFLYYGSLPDKTMSLFHAENQIRKDLKDKGQRKECGCIFSKDIGMYDTCPHHCLYCYANTSKKTVNQNFSKHNIDSESIIG